MVNRRGRREEHEVKMKAGQCSFPLLHSGEKRPEGQMRGRSEAFLGKPPYPALRATFFPARKRTVPTYRSTLTPR